MHLVAHCDICISIPYIIRQLLVQLVPTRSFPNSNPLPIQAGNWMLIQKIISVHVNLQACESVADAGTLCAECVVLRQIWQQPYSADSRSQGGGGQGEVQAATSTSHLQDNSTSMLQTAKTTDTPPCFVPCFVHTVQHADALQQLVICLWHVQYVLENAAPDHQY